MRFGDNRWWVQGATLTVERERSANWVEIGIAGLLGVGGGSLVLWLEDGLSIEAVVMLLLIFGIGMSNQLWLRRVVLRRETGRVDTMWGVGVPLGRRRRRLATFDRVQFETLAYRRRDDPRCVVRLAGPSKSVLLAEGGKEEEGLALAEAVSRQFGLPLQVDGGRTRAVEGSRVPASPGVTGSEVPGAPPEGSRVRVYEAGERRVLELPAPGWTGTSVAWAVVGAGLVLAGLFLCIYPFWKWYGPSLTGQAVAGALLSLAICALRAALAEAEQRRAAG